MKRCIVVFAAALSWFGGQRTYAQPSNACAPITSEQIVNFVVTATGTQTSNIYPDVSFGWTATVSAIETWTETVTGTTTAGVTAYGSLSGPDDNEVSFFPTASGTATISYSISISFSSGTGRVYLKDGSYVTIAASVRNTNGSYTFLVTAGREYRLRVTASGGGSGGYATTGASVSYPIQTTVQRTDTRSATQVGTGVVNATDGNKLAGVVNMQPQPQRGGSLGPNSYSVSDSSPDVQTSMSNNSVYAQTSLTQTGTVPWSRQEQGNNRIQANVGDVLLATSTLVAPNGDTQWAVTDDNEPVQTWMVRNQLYGRFTLTNEVLQVLMRGVQSANVSVLPVDLNQQGSDLAPFTRVFYNGQVVCLSAETNGFRQWEDPNGTVLSISPELQVKLDTSKAVLAVYFAQPQLFQVSRSADEVRFSWVSEPSLRYRIWWAAVLAADEWLSVGEIVAQESLSQWSDRSSRIRFPSGFYRVEVVR